MKSLLTRLQSYFKESYGGRYFELIIKELSVDAPEIINSIFPKLKFSPESHTVAIEYKFCVNGRNRQADIAIIDNATELLAGLAEVKYDDHLKESNSLQLEDYITVSKQHDIAFVYITQYFPPEDHYTKVINAGYKHLLFSELGEQLEKYTNNRTAPVRNLLLNYLKDKGYMFTDIDIDSLWKFMVRVFNAPRGHGKMRSTTDMTECIPSVFAGIMNNMYVINTEISRKLSPKLPVPKIVESHIISA